MRFTEISFIIVEENVMSNWQEGISRFAAENRGWTWIVNSKVKICEGGTECGVLGDIGGKGALSLRGLVL